MKNDIYGEPEIIKYKNIIAKVYTPIITDQEREKRAELSKKAAISLVLSRGKSSTFSCSEEIQRKSVGNLNVSSVTVPYLTVPNRT